MNTTRLHDDEILMLAKRLDHIEPFHVIRIITRAMELQSSGVDVVNLAVGEPDFPTPKLVVESGLRALREDRMKYQPALGSDELRNAISRCIGKDITLEFQKTESQ